MKNKHQGKLAKAVGCRESHISMILAGVRRPSPDLADRLEKITKGPLRLWLFGTPEEKRAVLERWAAQQAGAQK